jgi:hypothetical protein
MSQMTQLVLAFYWEMVLPAPLSYHRLYLHLHLLPVEDKILLRREMQLLKIISTT